MNLSVLSNQSARKAEMRPWVFGMVAAAHVVLLLLLTLMQQGCGTVKPAAQSGPAMTSSDGPVVMPPRAMPDVVHPPKPESKPPVKQWPADTTIYVVKQGDSISTIAHRYNVSVSEITALNPTIKPNKVRAGLRLVLPGKLEVEAPPAKAVKTTKASVSAKTAGAAPETIAIAPGGKYTVKAGDSLSLIAKKHGVTSAALRQANNLTGDKIRIGQKLSIPSASKPAEAGAPGPEAKPVSSPAAVTAPAPAPVVKPAPEMEVKPAPDVAPAPVSKPAPEPLGASKPAPASVAAPAAVVTKSVAAPAETSVAAAKPAPSPVKSGTPAYRTHVVEEDEDIYSVAMMWNVSVDKIKEVNHLTSTALKPGQRLQIPISE